LIGEAVRYIDAELEGPKFPIVFREDNTVGLAGAPGVCGNPRVLASAPDAGTVLLASLVRRGDGGISLAVTYFRPASLGNSFTVLTCGVLRKRGKREIRKEQGKPLRRLKSLESRL